MVCAEVFAERRHRMVETQLIGRGMRNQAVLTAHKTEPVSYFGWYRMSQASAGSPLFNLLTQAANRTFSGP